MSDTLDAPWLRNIATFSVLPAVVGVALSPLFFGERVIYFAALFSVALCAYFAHVLLLRFQTSLLEWLVCIVLLASAHGLTLSAPGVLHSPALVLVLAPLLSAWALYATIRAGISAELLRLDGAPVRSAWLLLHATLLLSPAFVLAGAAISIGANFPALSGSDFTPYGMPFLIAGVVGMLADFILRRRICRVARYVMSVQ